MKTFRHAPIEVVLGDREFLGQAWINYLQEKQVPYCIRLKEDWQVVRVDKASRPLSSLVPKNTTQATHLGEHSLGTGPSKLKTNLSAKRLSSGVLVVAHSPGLKNPCAYYRKRWHSETCFKSLKSNGFDMEATHLTESPRIESLVGVIALAFTLATQAGILDFFKKSTQD